MGDRACLLMAKVGETFPCKSEDGRIFEWEVPGFSEGKRFFFQVEENESGLLFIKAKYVVGLITRADVLMELLLMNNSSFGGPMFCGVQIVNKSPMLMLIGSWVVGKEDDPADHAGRIIAGLQKYMLFRINWPQGVDAL